MGNIIWVAISFSFIVNAFLYFIYLIMFDMKTGFSSLSHHIIIRLTGANLSAEQRGYNCCHSRARRVVENDFGILPPRWIVFRRAIECSADDITTGITKACMARCLSGTDQLQVESTRYICSTLVDEGEVPGKWRQMVEGDTNLLDPGCLTADHAMQLGTEVCNSLRKYFRIVTGKVAFQDITLQRGTVHYRAVLSVWVVYMFYFYFRIK